MFENAQKFADRFYKTPITRILRILAGSGETVYEKEYGLTEHEVAVTGLEVMAVYSLVFCPGGRPDIPQA